MNVLSIASIAIIVLAIRVLEIWGWWRRDDTDGKGKRSNLMLYTDYKTGVQYVGSPFGGITPRLDAQGNIVTKGV